jgi:anti-anti-sigma factor
MMPDARRGDAGAGAAPGRGGPPVLDQAFAGDSLYALRAAVAAHASQAGLPDGRVGDVVLAVHELASNAVCHGAGHGRVRIWNTGETLRCEVTDDGAAPAGTGGGSPDAGLWSIDPGHGLWLVRQVADQTSLRSGLSGTVAAVSFALGPQEELPPFHLAQRLRDGGVVLSVTGQLDTSSAGQFTTAVSDLAAAPPAGRTLKLILDLSGLTWWDSSGLAALITAQRRIAALPDARMVIAGLPGHLVPRLRDAGGFTLAGTIADALAMAARPAS